MAILFLNRWAEWALIFTMCIFLIILKFVFTLKFTSELLRFLSPVYFTCNHKLFFSKNSHMYFKNYYNETCRINFFLCSIMSISHFSRKRNWPGSCLNLWPSNLNSTLIGAWGSRWLVVSVKSTEAVICKTTKNK